ncbi:hypothetical protein KPH14_001805 [Odynerus spinipes]|uniref:Uncharacterized protein n=1 Tax=Odynerus spinipes TaxID=1348599 RepID=A0AAD9VXC0_9HYME|nr:hypothetical protein KPH14_001805 [Odynerus spinipes]
MLNSFFFDLPERFVGVAARNLSFLSPCKRKLSNSGRCSSFELLGAADAGNPEGAAFIQAETLCKFDKSAIPCLSARTTWDPVHRGENITAKPVNVTNGKIEELLRILLEAVKKIAENSKQRSDQIMKGLANERVKIVDRLESAKASSKMKRVD